MQVKDALNKIFKLDDLTKDAPASGYKNRIAVRELCASSALSYITLCPNLSRLAGASGSLRLANQTGVWQPVW